MAKSVKAKKNTRALAQQKRHRRQWLTFVRMCRYGINNFTRNAWLTVAATAVMTITLLIIFATVIASNVLADSVAELSKKVDMSIYLRTGTTEPVIHALRQLSNVENVAFISSEQARAQNAQNNKTDQDVLEAISQATNKLPAVIRINLKNINDTAQLDEFVKKNKELKPIVDPNRAPSFAGSRRNAIENIGRWANFAQRAGLAASILFVVISSLIVFNTIRMAIFNRKDEIEMMKLIGAEKSFIRGPFLVEAVVYGCIAAVLATTIGVSLFVAASEKLQSYGIATANTTNALTMYLGVVLLVMIGLGALIGVISSALATRRYLKI